MKKNKITNELIESSKKIYNEFNFSSAVRIDFSSEQKWNLLS